VSGAGQRRLPGRLLPVLAVGLCALVAALVYLPTLGYQLVWDDVNIIVHDQSSPFQAFVHSFWHGEGSGAMGADPYYRPLANFSLGLDELVAGHRAWYFHLVNLLLHATAVALVGLVVWQVFGSVWPVLVAGLACAVHPLAAGSVAYVSGRTDILACIGLLVAFLGLLRLRKRHEWTATALVWVGFTVAVFSKETAVAFPIIAGVWLTAPTGGLPSRKRWFMLGGLLILLGGYLASRATVLGSVVGMKLGGNVWSAPILSFSNFGQLLVDAVLPVQGTFRWSQESLGHAALAVIPGILYLGAPLLLHSIRRSREALIGWLWGAALLLPFAGFAGFGPAGRLLYVPGIGFVLVALFACRGIAGGSRRRGIAAVIVSLGYCATLALLVLPRQMGVWKDGYTLFGRMVTEAPGYPAAHYNFAFELRRRGDVDRAVAEYRRAIALDPDMALAYFNLGALLLTKGELAEAESLYRRTMELLPRYALAWNNLAVIRYKQGDAPGALRAVRRAIELEPNDAGAVYNMGRLYQQSGMADSAALMFERAYRLDPGNAQIRASYEQTRRQ